MKSVCVFSHKSFVPPTSGHNITLYNRFVGLVEEGYVVDFYVFGQEYASFNYDGINVHTCPISRLVRFIFFNKFFAPTMRRVRSVEAHLVLSSLDPKLASSAREKIKACDLVLVEHIWSSPFPILYARLFKKPLVLIDHNAETVLSRRFLREARQMTKFILFLRFAYTFLLERISCMMASLVVVSSENDRALLGRGLRVPVEKTRVIPPSIDTSIIKNDQTLGLRLRDKLGISEEALVVCFLGDLTTVPNYMAAEYIAKEMAPRVLGRLAEAYFLIIGRHDSRLSLLEDNRVIFTGEVSDLRPFLSAADICIVPLTLGSGVKLKLLTYLSFGKPIVSTPMGIEGINAKKGVIVCELQSFETEILKLASDRELRLKLGSIGRRLAEEVYDKHSVAKRLASILSEVVS